MFPRSRCCTPGVLCLPRRHVVATGVGCPASADGSVDVWRHFYYNRSWQVMEIRDALASAEKTENTPPETLLPVQQFVWSQRYIDAPVLRDADADSDEQCDESGDDRLYFLTDANMNVVAAVAKSGGTTGSVVENYKYTPYGTVTSSGTAQGAQPLFCGYWLDAETGLYHVRHRMYNPCNGPGKVSGRE